MENFEPSSPPPNAQSVPLFRPRATTLLRVALLGAALSVVAAAYATFEYYRSPYWNGVGLARDQPVLFSHRHHAGELRIDCRYCHVTVETSAFAGMPSTQTCMTCHSQIFTDTAMLRPVVLSAERQKPLHWNRVNSLPDHVFFNHSIHIAKGVSCTTCHGDVGDMPLMAKGEPLSMRWCLDCHRDPAPKLRPADEIFLPTRSAHAGGISPAERIAGAADRRTAPFETDPVDVRARGDALMQKLHIETQHLTNCSTCHH